MKDKFRATFDREQEVELSNGQGIYMMVRIRKVRMEVTSTRFMIGEDHIGVPEVWMMVKEFRVKTVEVIIVDSMVWSTCEIFTKKARFTPETRHC